MTTQDELWKAIIEELLDDFIQFFFTADYHKIDQSRPYEIYDNELSKIYPESDEIKRRGDKLVKVPILDGEDQFVLAHIEVQGYKEDNYGRRMYVCQYRIDERFGLPVAALVIYSDKNKQNRASHYERKTLGTKLTYEFPTFVIADHTAAEYEQMDNPFAVVCQVALAAVSKKDISDEELLELKVYFFKKLLKKDYSKNIIRALTIFIKEYKNFENSEFYHSFDKEIEKLSKNKQPMGIEETVIAYRSRAAVAEAHNDGVKKGIEEGIEKGIEKGLEKGELKATAILNYTNVLKIFLHSPNWTITQIADFFEIKVVKIKKLKAILAFPSEAKMQKGILDLFFKGIELNDVEMKKIFDLATKYQKQTAQN